MIKAVVFDCFGVLVTDALSALTAQLQHDPVKLRAAHDIIHAANKGFLERTESNHRMAELFGMTASEYRHRLDTDEVKNEQLIAYIRELRTNYKTAMLSNITGAGIRHRFTADELSELFDEVVVSGEIGYAKPEAEAYEIVADRLGVRLDECVFTDDRDTFCEAARAVGMEAIVFTDTDQFKNDLETLLADS